MGNEKIRTKDVTMADIAAALNVSNVTVSNALANRKGVSAKMRNAILIKAREMGYRYDGDETDMTVYPKSGNIAVICPERFMSSQDGYCRDIYLCLVAELKKYDCYTMLDTVSTADENARRLPPVIENGMTSGAIIIGRLQEPYITNICTRSIPVVFLDSNVRDFDFDSVAGNDYDDMYRLTSYIMSRGHRHILYAGETAGYGAHFDRFMGYCKALAEHEITFDGEMKFESGKSPEDYTVKPTAVVCDNGESLETVSKWAEEHGLSCPGDISLAYYCTGTQTDEKYTCIKREPERLANLAAAMLRARVAGVKKKAGKLTVAGRLIAGTTTKTLIR